jgi:TRAP-type C4-dicarboxylate transport system permease small subunit
VKSPSPQPSPRTRGEGADTAWRGIKQAADAVSCLMFGCVFMVFAYKIIMRYLAHDAVAWADEVSVILFVWIIFWANAFVLDDRRQIRFDLLYRLINPAGQRAFAVIRLLIIGGLFVWALPGFADYTLFLWRERTPVLGLRLDIVYSCFGLFAAALVIRCAWSLFVLARPGWREQV